MRPIITAAFFLLLFHATHASSISVSGNVTGTWSADTILVEGNLVIQPGEMLFILPGTVVQFQSYYRMEVLGRISAEGAPGDSIIFTIRDTSNFYAQSQGRGGWSGIRFRQLAASEDSSVFSFCRFEFSKATEDSANCYGGAILAHNFDKLRLDHCLFYHNYSFYSGGAVYLNNADALIQNCIFSNNYSGNTGTVYGYGGGICSINSSPLIKKDEFYHNSSTGVGGGISFENSNPVFENNIMQYNYSALGGALGVLRSSPVSTLSNNLVVNNNALFFGGGICCIRSFPVFSNLTVSGNSASYAGAFYCNDSAAPSMYNSILWGNYGMGPSVYIWDVNSAPNFYYCDIEGDTSGFEGSGAHLGYHGQYLNNLNENPRYAASGMFPYRLSPASACIDAGTPDAEFLHLPATDLSGDLRVVNNRVDMGAYEYSVTSAAKPYNKTGNMLTVYPNPFTRTVIISLPESIHQITELRITDSKGRTVKRMSLNVNTSSLSWNAQDENGNDLPNGIYFLTVQIGEHIYTVKAIKQN